MIEADFQRYYGLDLRIEESRSSVRRLVALISTLPRESALSRLHDGDSKPTATNSSGEPKTVITNGAAFASWINTKAKKA